MDSISLNCPKCQQILKFPAGRAGTEGKCTRCNESIAIPSVPPPAPSANGDDEDGGTYGLVPVIEEKKALPTESKNDEKKKAIDPSLRKKKKLQDGDKWNLVRGGLTVLSSAAGASGVILGVQMLVLLLGCMQESEYNPVRLKALFDIKTEEDLADKFALHRNHFAFALVYGLKYLTAFKTVQILLSVVSIFPVVLFLIGYFGCRLPPRRFGMRGQVKAMIILAFVNVSILVVFKILPLMDVMRFTPLPYLVPELPVLNANAERYLPIHVVYMGWSAFFEILLTILFTCSLFAEGALGGLFLHTIGFTIKEEELRDAGTGLIHLALGAPLAYTVYHLFSICGCSEVLISCLRCVYLFALFIQFFYIYRYVTVLNLAKATLDKRMEDMTEEELELKDDDEDKVYDDDEDDEEDDDDDDENKDRKKKARRKRDEDDDDERPKGKRKRGDDDDDDDRPKKKRKRDDDDDDEDDRPRPRKKR